ncbi:hypothetical protein BV25DRAFT_1805827 [Artomyces pyxidatus]|uniref:Uncharacterized protein n=1 Tax=Artomyces pyxidatus TaxID=48021 RepID=A0ACB8SXL9_9AGAM|nr:hypothetical protein BV25DRAFT_1805827 [Artomyces pyxidatus]
MAHPRRPNSWVFVGSNPVFLDALEEHKKRLLPEELVDFDVSSPCVVIEDAKNLHADHRTKSRTRRCIERFSDLVRPLEALFSAIDSNVASNSQLAGIVWGAIRFVVKVINSVAAHFKIIEETLQAIPAYLRFFHDYATFLFVKSERVLQALAGVYGDILNMCTIIRRRYYKKDGRLRGEIPIYLFRSHDCVHLVMMYSLIASYRSCH